MTISKIINYKALSEELTGSSTKITRSRTAEKYIQDIQELNDLINVWLKWKKDKHDKTGKR